MQVEIFKHHEEPRHEVVFWCPTRGKSGVAFPGWLGCFHTRAFREAFLPSDSLHLDEDSVNLAYETDGFALHDYRSVGVANLGRQGQDTAFGTVARDGHGCREDVPVVDRFLE